MPERYDRGRPKQRLRKTIEKIIYRFAKKRDEESESRTAAPETAAESERRTCRGSATELTFAMREVNDGSSDSSMDDEWV